MTPTEFELAELVIAVYNGVPILGEVVAIETFKAKTKGNKYTIEIPDKDALKGYRNIIRSARELASPGIRIARQKGGN